MDGTMTVRLGARRSGGMLGVWRCRRRTGRGPGMSGRFRHGDAVRAEGRGPRLGPAARLEPRSAARERGPRLLPPRAIVGSLYRRGYRDVEIRRRRGPSYVAEATGRRGRVLVVVDGRTAEITGLKVLDWDRPPPPL